jgi:hypothetical protein
MCRRTLLRPRTFSGAARSALDDAGRLYVIGLDGHTHVFGQWLRPTSDEADVPLAVSSGAAIRERAEGR